MADKKISALEGLATPASGDLLEIVDVSQGTNKQITYANLISVTADSTTTFTNKTVDLTDNTLTGTTAEFNAALSDGSFVTLAGTETLTNKTLTSPVLNTSVSGTAVLDEDDMSSDSATKLATQQSIKAYVDSQTPPPFKKEVYFDAEVDNGNSGTADTIDWTAGNKQKSTLTDDVTFTFTDPSGPANLILKLVQDATGSRTVTWPAEVLWPEGTAPTLSTAANAVDIVSFYFDGTNYFGQGALNFS